MLFVLKFLIADMIVFSEWR